MGSPKEIRNPKAEIRKKDEAKIRNYAASTVLKFASIRVNRQFNHPMYFDSAGPLRISDFGLRISIFGLIFGHWQSLPSKLSSAPPMPTIKPFAAVRPKPDLAARIC